MGSGGVRSNRPGRLLKTADACVRQGAVNTRRQHWCLQKSNGLLLGAVEAKAGTWASTTSACVDRYMSLEVMAARVRHGVESPRSQRGPTLRQLSRYIETQLSVQHGCVCEN